jgi:hypothetical protein
MSGQASVDVPFPPTVAEQLGGFAAWARTTPFLVLLAAYRILLTCWSGWDRVVLGTTTLGRHAPGAQHVVGQFTTNVYLAVTVSPRDTLREVLGRMHEEMLGAVRHAAPYTEIARAVHPGFDACRPWPFLNLYDAWFQSTAGNESTTARSPRGPRADVQSAPVGCRTAWTTGRRGCPADLQMWAKRGEPGFVLDSTRHGGSTVFCPAFYPEAMVSAVTARLPGLVEDLLADPYQTVGDVSRQRRWE